VNIAYVSFVSPESVSGENAFMLGLASSIARQPDLRLFLICPAPTNSRDVMLVEAVTMIYLPPKQSGSFRWTLGVQSAILRALQDVERSTGGLDGIVVALRPGAIAPALYAWLRGVPEILVVESLETKNVGYLYGAIPGSGLFMNLVTWVNSLQSVRVLAAFEAVRTWIGRMPLVSPDKVERFHHGVNAEHYQLSETTSLRASLDLPFSAEDFVVGFAGSFKWYHCVDLLLRAAADSSLDHVRILLVGQGPTLDDCQVLAADLGLMKLYEYMASGAPFVYVINDETRFIQDMGVGYGIPGASVSEVTGAIKHLSSLSPSVRQAMVERGRSFVLRNCSWDLVASRIVAGFENK
jgi:glycosyltransferase involved in cell wall biosynthesis